MIKRYLFFSLFIVTILSSCQQTADTKISSLKLVFADDFLIGTALNEDQIKQKNKTEDSLIRDQFNVLTAENSMKCQKIHPEWGEYDFTLADKLVELAQKNTQEVIGHTLIWHSQLSPFVEKITSKDSLQLFFQDHIKTIAARFDKKIKGWDVVNEALNEDGTMRETIFYKFLGENYVTEAFRLAQEYAPNSELYYNDYNIEEPAKRAGAIQLIRKIKEAGVRIDAVGIQGHWQLGKVPFGYIEESILAFDSMGLDIMITELDIEVLPRNFSGAAIDQTMALHDSLNPYKTSLPVSVEEQLTNDYNRLFALFLKHKDKISRVTFWGVHDGQSWLNNWPVKGRTNYPLLFDRNYKPKPAFYQILKLKDSAGKQPS